MVASRHRIIGLLAVVCTATASAALAEVTTVSYRETAESFTWELRWDGHPSSSSEDIQPAGSPGENAGLWAPVLKLSLRPRVVETRFAFHARHAARAHDLDAPQGPGYNGIFLLRLGGWRAKDWVRLDRRLLLHLSTPKDTLDTFDVFWAVETSADGGKIGRLILQGAHGAAGRPKKPRKTKARTGETKASRSSP